MNAGERPLVFGDVIRYDSSIASYNTRLMVIDQEAHRTVTYAITLDTTDGGWAQGWIEPIYHDDLMDYELLT